MPDRSSNGISRFEAVLGLEGWALFTIGLGQAETAHHAFESFLAGSPGNPSAYDSLADGLVALDRTDAAVAQLTRSLLLEPRFACGWRHMGDILRDAGEPALARAACSKALESAEKYGPSFSSGVESRLSGLP